jgi:hypothetical protein
MGKFVLLVLNQKVCRAKIQGMDPNRIRHFQGKGRNNMYKFIYIVLNNIIIFYVFTLPLYPVELNDHSELIQSLEKGLTVKWGTRIFSGDGLYMSGYQGVDNNVTEINCKIDEEIQVGLIITNGISEKIFMSAESNACYIGRKRIFGGGDTKVPFYLLNGCQTSKTGSGDLISGNTGYYEIVFPYKAKSVPGEYLEEMVLNLQIYFIGESKINNISIRKSIKVVVREK